MCSRVYQYVNPGRLFENPTHDTIQCNSTGLLSPGRKEEDPFLHTSSGPISPELVSATGSAPEKYRYGIQEGSVGEGPSSTCQIKVAVSPGPTESATMLDRHNSKQNKN